MYKKIIKENLFLYNTLFSLLDIKIYFIYSYFMKVLIIEDDRDTAEYLEQRLREKCFVVDRAHDGISGIAHAKAHTYDVILLDYELPGRNGLLVGHEIRNQDHEERKHVPIIMISVTCDVDHRVAALESGCDDYLMKPFFFDELLARIYALLRRPSHIHDAQFTIDDLLLDTTTQKVFREGREIYLTRKEFSLLEFLLRHKGTIVSRGHIGEHVWDKNINPFSNTVEMHILNLRRKIEQGSKKRLIHSISGRGYKIDDEK